MSHLAVRGATVVDAGGARRSDVLVDGGRIVAVGEAVETPKGSRALDGSGCFLLPGLVDLHAHLRDPGDPESETIETASRAAALGGYTAVVAMPNTTPAIDGAEMVRYVHDASRSAPVEVVPAGAITLGRKGETLAPLGEMAELGVTLFTDDGSGVQDPLLMRRAMEYARGLGVTLAEHCEDLRLAAGGHMHEGAWSSSLGIPGVPAEAEELMALRDVMLARLTGCRLHLLHVSTAAVVSLVARAKTEGVLVTAEVTPHHLALTDREVASYDPIFKVNPPLRSREHLGPLLSAVLDGTIDAIATDHAPHPAQAKEQPFDQAPCGMLGLETALAVVFSVLTGSGDVAAEGANAVRDPVDAMATVVESMSRRPASIAGITGRQGGAIAPGEAANFCVFDPSSVWVVERSRLASLSSNTPYEGRKLTGKVRHTVFRGDAVVVDGEAQR